MKWFYGAVTMDNFKGRMSNDIVLVSAESREEAVGIVAAGESVRKSLAEGFGIRRSDFYEIDADTVRQMAADYGIIPEGGGK